MICSFVSLLDFLSGNLAEREDFEPITLTAYATISFFSKISNR